MKTEITRIITHEYPDFDCLYAIFLLKKFGSSKYANITDARLEFVPAGSLPNDKAGIQLLESGALAIDIKHGHYDHHSDNPKGHEHCSASLIAMDLQIDKDPALQKILNFIKKNDLHGVGIQSKEAVDHLIAIPTIIRGLNLKYSPNYQITYNVCEQIFDALYGVEKDWFQALEDIANGKHCVIGDNFKILSFTSYAHSASKAGRFKQGNICIINGEGNSINITTWKSKKWMKPDLTKISGIIRLAEAKAANVKVADTQLMAVGTIMEWFLHESREFLSRGGFKKSDCPKSELTAEDLMGLVAFSFKPEPNLLGRFASEFLQFKTVLDSPIKVP